MSLTSLASMSLVLALLGAPEIGRGGEDGTIRAGDSRPGDEEDESEEVARVRARPERSYYRVVLWNPAQGFCVGWRSTTDAAYARRQNETGFGIRFGTATDEPYENCARPSTATPSAAPDPRAIAADSWEKVENLPVPSLDIQPDHAITGKKVYLQIAGLQTWTKTIDNPIGDDIVITATSDYIVDWGDPTFPGTTVTKSQGGPFPSGNLTHVYTDTAPKRSIQVTQRWKATWRAGARSGTLGQLTTQAAPLDLEIRELQAVRNR